MGSFDATCILSDIGISCGDEVYVVPLIGPPNMTRHGNGNWTVAALPFEGVYDDYGCADLMDSSDGEAFIDLIRGHIVPLEPGPNSVHDLAVDPDTMTWADFQSLDHDSRTFVTEEPREPAGQTHTDIMVAHGPGQITARLADAGIKVKPIGVGPDADGASVVHNVYGVGLPGSNVVCIELPWDAGVQDSLIPRIRAALEPLWSTMVTDAPGRANTEGKPPQRAMLVAPAPGNVDRRSIYFGRPDYDREHLRLTRGFIRKDVFDALVPDDEETVEMATLLMEARKEFSAPTASGFPSAGYLLKHRLSRMTRSGGFDFDKRLNGLWFKPSCDGTELGGDLICKQILALPEDAGIDAYIPFVRLTDLIRLTGGPLRRGLRPTVAYVGSQFAQEDWPEQAEAHEKLAAIAAKAAAT